MRLLIFGSGGRLGPSLVRKFERRYEISAPRSSDCDITKLDEVAECMQRVRPTHVINAAALVGMKECEDDKDKAWDVNVNGAINIARLCQKYDSRLIFISSAAIFDGTKGNYAESDTPTPTYFYAVTKVAAEQAMLMTTRCAVVRLDFFDPTLHLKYDRVYSDHYTSKCTVDEISSKLEKLLESDFNGIINIGNQRRQLFEIMKEYYPNVKPIKIADSRLPNFPRDISLDLSLWNKVFER